jgi:glycine/D-amino acid oxidase-like deaminating enzyme
MKTSRVVVIGGGVAGSAIALELAQQGQSVTLVYRSAQEGSSFTNQKWNHSGLLYPDKALARKACEQFLRDSPLQNFIIRSDAHARFLALSQQTLDERIEMWSEWDVSSWGLDWRPLCASEYEVIGALGKTSAVGGFAVPDRIVDFPGLVDDLRHKSTAAGVEIVANASVSRILTRSGKVVGVSLGGQDAHRIDCGQCVLAAGAYSRGILSASGITPPDLILRKCVVFEYDGELVHAITTCLDVLRHDGTKQDVTLVPFRNKTLAAGTGFTEVTTGDDTEPDEQEVGRLRNQLAQCFPTLGDPSRIITCTKAEKWPGGKPNVNSQVYDESQHEVRGLLVTIPGKASFMFDLASAVSHRIAAAEL